MRIIVQLFVALVVIAIVEYTAALQCYTCDHCLDEDELAVLQICGASTTRRPRPTTTTTTTTKGGVKKTTTAANKTTKSPSNSDYDEDDYSDDDDESGDEKPNVTTAKTTRRPANIRTTKKTTAATTTDSGKDDDDNDSEDEYYDDDDDRRRRHREVRPVPRVNEAVCYMIKLRVNGSVVTKRGCTAMRPNNILTCHSLHDDDQPMEDCQLCDTNLCNKFQFNNMDYLELWNGATPSAIAARWLVGLALTVLLMRHSN